MRVLLWTTIGLFIGLVVGASLGFAIGYVVADATTPQSSKEMLGVGAVSGMFIGALAGPIIGGIVGLWWGGRSTLPPSSQSDGRH
jgi:hypothetical protein